MNVSTNGSVATVTIPHTSPNRQPLMLTAYMVFDARNMADESGGCMLAAKATTQQLDGLMGVYGVLEITADDLIFTINRTVGNSYWTLPLLSELAQTLGGLGSQSDANALWGAAVA